MDLTPLPRRPSAVDQCADRLRRAILAGELAPGVRLPAERDLATRLGVNRVTVRGALGQLTSGGLLSVRQGSGYTVRDYQRDGGPDLLPGLADLAATSGDLPALLDDLLLVRRQLARALLERLAARRPDPGPVAAAVAGFAEAAREGDLDAVVDADLAVLAALLDASGSPVLHLCLNPVTAVLRQLDGLRAAMFRDPSSNLEGWRLLLAWLHDPVSDAIPGIVAVLEARDAATLLEARQGATLVEARQGATLVEARQGATREGVR